MSRISSEGTNYYAVVYGLNCRKLKDNMTGHRGTQWKIMEECLKDIHNIGMGYELAKGYCRAELGIQDTSGINEIKPVKKTDLCFKCGGPHFQYKCTSNSNKIFQNKTTQV